MNEQIELSNMTKEFVKEQYRSRGRGVNKNIRIILVFFFSSTMTISVRNMNGVVNDSVSLLHPQTCWYSMLELHVSIHLFTTSLPFLVH